ncbi:MULTISPECIES: aminotransferase class V-fold PLP-dependent enzyme [unclassified Parafrankia]|uniref:aminotransferase class V-fold PLP-dependent enzyme n=1 Tax=unclassified Parafrankia TaxID=2994368 RepID=UPI000DA4B25E|nr:MULTISPECIES: aminotransferase class V-fold PLP-dependent enzyme [unclassified Parafrankia]TCJ33090.1 aminotransferase class V-fold PLP-dependent enzyme [Parafrankia sp. BMG5.11]SQD93894.1 Cysteine desulfurase [Parafrankia sp. Ea1.12]
MSFSYATTSPDVDREGPAVGALLDVVGASLPVPLADGREVPYANLDQAASAPCLRGVAEHVERVLPYSASVHRGTGYSSAVCTALYEGARDAVRTFVGGRPDDVVIFTRNTTDSVNLLARCLPPQPPDPARTSDPSHAVPGGVVVFDLEHHANLLPWRSRPGCRWVPAAPTRADTLRALATALDTAPTSLVAVTGASNVTGEVPPLAEIVRLARAAGARVFVDGAQLVPHRRVDMAALGIDYLAFSGHKLYAPFGAGVLVGRPDWLAAAPPYLAGGGAVREVTSSAVAWADGPARHEAGSPNLLGATAIAAACRLLGALDARDLHQHEDLLRRRLVDGLRGIEGVTIHSLWADGDDPAAGEAAGDGAAGGAAAGGEAVDAGAAGGEGPDGTLATGPVGVVTFSVAGRDPGYVAAVLSAEHGVGVRAGRFCAHPLLGRLGAEGGAIRASVGISSTSADVDRLLAGLAELVGRGPRQQYRDLGDGGWAPAADGRALPPWVAEHMAAGHVRGRVPAPGHAYDSVGLPAYSSPCGT